MTDPTAAPTAPLPPPITRYFVQALVLWSGCEGQDGQRISAPGSGFLPVFDTIDEARATFPNAAIHEIVTHGPPRGEPIFAPHAPITAHALARGSNGALAVAPDGDVYWTAVAPGPYPAYPKEIPDSAWAWCKGNANTVWSPGTYYRSERFEVSTLAEALAVLRPWFDPQAR